MGVGGWGGDEMGVGWVRSRAVEVEDGGEFVSACRGERRGERIAHPIKDSHLDLGRVTSNGLLETRGRFVVSHCRFGNPPNSPLQDNFLEREQWRMCEFLRHHTFGKIRDWWGPKLLLNRRYWQVSGNKTIYKRFGECSGKARPYIQRILIQIGVASQLVPHCKEIKPKF